MILASFYITNSMFIIKAICEGIDSMYYGAVKISQEWKYGGCAHHCGCSNGTKQVFKGEIESYGPSDLERIYKTVTCEKCQGSGLSGEPCDIVGCPQYYSFEENYPRSARTVARS